MANEHLGATGTPEASVQPPVFAGAARRRFAKTGAAAIGAVLTVKSQPGMAAAVCQSPSAQASGNLSAHPHPGVVCSGLSPGYWKNHPGAWSNMCSYRTVFQKVFLCSSGSPFYNKTMMTLCSPQSYDKNNVAMHIVAAYQNALWGKTSFLTPAMVIEIWRQYYSTGGPGVGYYIPVTNGSIKWYGPQIVTYLSGTMA